MRHNRLLAVTCDHELNRSELAEKTKRATEGERVTNVQACECVQKITKGSCDEFCAQSFCDFKQVFRGVF